MSCGDVRGEDNETFCEGSSQRRIDGQVSVSFLLGDGRTDGSVSVCTWVENGEKCDKIGTNSQIVYTECETIQYQW